MHKKIFSAIVAILFSAVICSAQSVVYFPQFVDGGSLGSGFWGSIIAVSNPAAVGSAAVNGTVTLTKPDGTTLNLQFYDENGAPIPNAFALGGGQTKLFES